MAKKKVIEKKSVSANDVLKSNQALLEKRVEQLEKRIDRLVVAISKSKSVRNI